MLNHGFLLIITRVNLIYLIIQALLAGRKFAPGVLFTFPDVIIEFTFLMSGPLSTRIRIILFRIPSTVKLGIMSYLAMGILHHSRQTLALVYLRMVVPISLNMANICRHLIRIQRARNLLESLPLEIQAIGLQTT